MFRTLARRTPRTFVPARAFSAASTRSADKSPDHLSTNSKTKTDLYDGDTPHAKDKVREGDTHNVQESNMKDALDKKGKAGGHAVEERDSAGGTKKAKEEFPEAPDPAIGMQDERGGRGGR
ncbi:hypothetical protein ACN47E_004383 [Coniothyrium glycines]